jgi:hypothetical protein
MPMRIIAGLNRKLGLPGYGSAGASCAVEIELEQSALQGDPAAIQTRIAALYELCRESIARQLTIHESSHEPNGSNVRSGGNGHDGGSEPRLAPQESSTDALATERQITFAHHLARQIRTLGGQRLRELAQQRYARPLEELSSVEASQLIDLLKDLRAGKQAVAEVLPGTAA